MASKGQYLEKISQTEGRKVGRGGGGGGWKEGTKRRGESNLMTEIHSNSYLSMYFYVMDFQGSVVSNVPPKMWV